MAALEDARALVDELREIHARSRENAREQGWGVPPESEDHSPWSRAADMIDRLTTPPTDDEREALADVVKAADFSAPDESLQGVDEYWRAWKLHMADAILAAGFRRRGPITDEMADSAQRAWHDYVWGPGEPMARRDLGITRQAWKAALEAAERAR